MEEVIQQMIERRAKAETLYQIVIAILAVTMIVGFMSKHFKSIMEALPSIRKALSYVQGKWFRRATFEKQLVDAIAQLSKDVREVKAEVKYNGGKVVLADAVKRIEESVSELKESVEYNRQVREIDDRCSDTMRFKVDPEGKCFFINEAFLKWFGVQESDVLGFGFEELVHEEDRPEMRLKWQKAIDYKTNFKDEQRIKDCNGTYHKCLVSAYSVVIGGNLKKFKGIIEVIND